MHFLIAVNGLLNVEPPENLFCLFIDTKYEYQNYK